ncbi:hypothetical protein EK21DRAFT_106792 [Setomelanomma holmii]|uniref:C2H2-type domain-containing protein n=1 Tax=Setomelanomma holmii TaxID=210430 RepID=A0A9P4LTM9_9PLEO|nr:hypothetical protein EK21DRAFT_106792 [Setomelanomma holmii]
MAVQFRDLPQIPHHIDESRYTAWGADPYSYNQFYKQHNINFNSQEDMYFADFDNGMVSMQPMERFMHDQYPITHGVLHAKIPLERQLGRQYDPQWPSVDFRNVSPDRTSGSSYDTQNELRSPHAYPAASYGSPTDMFSQISLPYPTTESFKVEGCLTPNIPLHGGSTICTLRQLEYEHPEPEPVVEDVDDTDLKQEACDHDQISVKMETTSSVGYKEYADSGIGNSVRDAESVEPIVTPEGHDDPASDSDYKPANRKKRRSSTSNSSLDRSPKRKDSNASKTSNSSKVTKRGRRASNTVKKCMDADDDRRHFPCPLAAYGCNSTFSSKNEWKRHVSTQHIKLGYWRCDLCPPTTDPNDDQTSYYNDFNRKDLFTQHLRRMHAAPKDGRSGSPKEFSVTEDNLPSYQVRCLQSLRTAPQQSNCLFCEKTFEGPQSWEERMEHVGRHLEKDRKGSVDMLDIKSWNEDRGLEQYLLDEGLIVKEHGNWKIGDGKRKAIGESDEESDAE